MQYPCLKNEKFQAAYRCGVIEEKQRSPEDDVEWVGDLIGFHSDH